MNRLSLVRLVLFALCAFAVAPVVSSQGLEIIPLRHRTVEQVLPALQPLLEPGGTLSGSRGQLFLRASPANAAEIKQALAAIDRPARRLEISVRFDDALARERRGVEASGSLGRDGARIGITADDARRAATERVDQRLQVLEGSHAFILAGQELGSGFEVVPVLSGSEVNLEILHQRERQAGASVVRAPLGQWVEVAAVARERSQDNRSIASARTGRASETRRVWVKVEEIAN